MSRSLATAIFGITLMAALPASAAPPVTGAGFHSEDPTNTSIQYTRSWIFNSSTSASNLKVVADYGLTGPNEYGTFYADVYVYGNGGTISCYLELTNVANSSDYYDGGASTTSTGYQTLSLTATIPAASIGNYGKDVVCLLPSETGGNAAYIIYAE